MYVVVCIIGFVVVNIDDDDDDDDDADDDGVYGIVFEMRGK